MGLPLVVPGSGDADAPTARQVRGAAGADRERRRRDQRHLHHPGRPTRACRGLPATPRPLPADRLRRRRPARWGARMIGVLIGAVLGLGLFLVWWSWWPSDETRVRAPREHRIIRRLSGDLAQAVPRDRAYGPRRGVRHRLPAHPRHRHRAHRGPCHRVVLRGDSRRCARARRAHEGACATVPSAGSVKGRGRQHHLRGARRPGAARGALPARGARPEELRPASATSRATTARPAVSTTASTGSRTGSPTQWGTASWSRCESPASLKSMFENAIKGVTGPDQVHG